MHKPTVDMWTSSTREEAGESEGVCTFYIVHLLATTVIHCFVVLLRMIVETAHSE